MNNRFAGKLSLNTFYGMQKDWKGRKKKVLLLTVPILLSSAWQLVNKFWAGGKMVGTWLGWKFDFVHQYPTHSGNLNRQADTEPFETKWLSWIGPWSFHSFIGQMEDERDPTIDYPNHYLWGMRGGVRPHPDKRSRDWFFQNPSIRGRWA